VFNFSWVIVGQVAGMGQPDVRDLPRLRAEGITAVVSLTRRPALPADVPELRVLHLPVIDMMPPSVEQMRQAVEFIESEVRSGGRVAVHCLAGQGRTGTVLAALFVARGDDPSDAVVRVRDLRPGSIETVAQELAVHKYAESLRPGGGEEER
jgi:atypical dual specificity phosphatase